MMARARLARSELARADLRWTTSGTGYRPGRNALSYTLGNPGRPAKEPTLLIVISDDSGSVIGPTGADPVSNRYEEARRAFEAIGRRGGKHELGTIIHFDTPTSGDVPPTPLTKPGLQRLRSGLHLPGDAAGTSYLGPSLSTATRWAQQYPNYLATLVVLSDFELFDSNVDQVLIDLADFPGAVYAVVLGGTQLDGLLHDRIHVSPITHDHPPGAVARAVFTSLTTHRPGSRPA